VSVQSNVSRGVKLAGSDAPLVHVGASEQEAHWPQSTGQVSQFSVPLQMPSPHTWGPLYPESGSVQSQAPHPLAVHDWVPVWPLWQ
jgi:hypothetical protein